MEMDNKPGSLTLKRSECEDAVHCLSWRSRGLCICLWPGQSHRSSRCCSLTGECSGLPGLCGYTADTHTRAHIHHNPADRCARMCAFVGVFACIVSTLFSPMSDLQIWFGVRKQQVGFFFFLTISSLKICECVGVCVSVPVCNWDWTMSRPGWGLWNRCRRSKHHSQSCQVNVPTA